MNRSGLGVHCIASVSSFCLQSCIGFFLVPVIRFVCMCVAERVLLVSMCVCEALIVG